MPETQKKPVTEMISTRQAAERADISPRYMQTLLKEGRVVGATRLGAAYAVEVEKDKPPTFDPPLKKRHKV